LAQGLAIAGSTVAPPRRFVIGIGGALLGWATLAALLLVLNGTLDRREYTTETVELGDVHVTTYQGLIKTYQVAYSGAGGSSRISINPIHLHGVSRDAQLVTHPGALGMRWVELQLRHPSP
jgi:hypothetical protein